MTRVHGQAATVEPPWDGTASPSGRPPGMSKRKFKRSMAGWRMRSGNNQANSSGQPRSRSRSGSAQRPTTPVAGLATAQLGDLVGSPAALPVPPMVPPPHPREQDAFPPVPWMPRPDRPRSGSRENTGRSKGKFFKGKGKKGKGGTKGGKKGGKKG